MKRLLIAFAALSLAGCNATAGPITVPTPVEYANRTAVDEQAAVGVENAYKAFRLALELGVDTGVIKGERAVRAAKADHTAYNALLVLRSAYKTANSEDFLAAARSANIAIAQGIAAVRSN
jgi:hypothetical protein